MTNEEAKTFLDNLKVCIEEHPIVADWLVEIADRKSEPQTEMEKSGSRAVQTARCLNCHNAKACKEKHWEGCRYEPWKLTAVEDEPQTEDFFRQPTEEEMKSVRDYIDSISVPTGVNVFDLMDEPQTDCSWKKGE